MIRLDNVTKRYANGTVAVHELSLEIDAGEICVLVGPSGCGKTTTMRMINRLIEPSDGHIYVDGDDVMKINPVELRRRIGYVIQQVGLFPHQTIGTNVATVPRLLGWPKAKIRPRVDELLDLVGLDPSEYRNRYPSQLSGGQRQRVGVARALGADPLVLLMDEPFGAIDPINRERLQDEFLRLQAEVRKTVVFVTHDIEEAVKLGDRIAILREGGFLAQYDAPAEILAHPSDRFVADFVGADRALKLLQVTPLDLDELEQPLVLGADLDPESSRRRLEGSGHQFAVVLRDDRTLEGYISRDGTVRRLEAWVRDHDTLKDALSQMLLYDAGWVTVLDHDDRFLGVLTPDTMFAATRRAQSAGAGHAPATRDGSS